MKNLQKLLIIIILSLGFYSCGDHRLSQTLADIESYIDSRFERMIDKDMDGMMTRLRKGCPGLSESEYMMACYYFAGFDNTTVMVVMNLTSTDNVRTRKKRLRQKIAGFGKVGEEFLRYF